MLLVDSATDESDEYHEDAFDTVHETILRQPFSLRMEVIQDHDEILERYNPELLPLDEDGMRLLPPIQHDEVEVWIREWYTPSV